MRNAGKIMIVVAAATALVACSPSREAPSDIPRGEQPVHTPAPASVSHSAAESEGGSEDTHAGQADECTAEDITVNVAGEQPRVTIPRDCTAPSKVLTADIEGGVGAGAEPGSTVVANYQVVGWSDGRTAVNTYEQDAPESFQLGQPHEIEGLNEGLADLKQNGTRLIVLPPDLGYSEQSGNPLAQDTIVIVATATQVITS